MKKIEYGKLCTKVVLGDRHEQKETIIDECKMI